jgi:hypothetical protein
LTSAGDLVNTDPSEVARYEHWGELLTQAADFNDLASLVRAERYDRVAS